MATMLHWAPVAASAHTSVRRAARSKPIAVAQPSHARLNHTQLPAHDMLRRVVTAKAASSGQQPFGQDGELPGEDLEAMLDELGLEEEYMDDLGLENPDEDPLSPAALGARIRNLGSSKPADQEFDDGMCCNVALITVYRTPVPAACSHRQKLKMHAA